MAVLLGGQPGAGKSRAAQFAAELHGRELVVINGDDFRRFHPAFKRLQRDEPERMASVTQAVSSPLVERAIEHARAHRVSVLVEGTFRDPAVALRTAEAFCEAGFDVHAVAVAVPPEVSRASTLGRYFETLGTSQNRWTPPQAHDVAVRGMPSTVEALGRSAAVARFSVVTRDGQVLADNVRAGTQRARQVRGVVEATHSRPLTGQERALVAAIRDEVRRTIERTPASPQRAAVDVARLAFGAPATEATRTKTLSPRAGPQRPAPGALSDRSAGIGD